MPARADKGSMLRGGAQSATYCDALADADDGVGLPQPASPPPTLDIMTAPPTAHSPERALDARALIASLEAAADEPDDGDRGGWRMSSGAASGSDGMSPGDANSPLPPLTADRLAAFELVEMAQGARELYELAGVLAQQVSKGCDACGQNSGEH